MQSAKRSSKHKFILYAATFAIACGLLSLLVIGAELLVRFVDGYQLLALELRFDPARARKSISDGDKRAQEIQLAAAGKAVASIPLAPGMSREWFELSPEPIAKGERSSILAASAEIYGRANPYLYLEGIHVFNSRLVRDSLCKNPFFRNVPGFLFVFDPPRPTPYPRYRFPRDVVAPTGLVTNNFGWRGPHIEFRKPANIIRIGFAGASTTVNNHGFPFSYPELTGFWLNKWLEETGSAFRVQIMNVGREGINSTDIAAIVEDELAPMEPDIVVYYEGSNQFRLEPLVVARSAMWLGASKIAKFVQSRSAIARRIQETLPGQFLPEPERSYIFKWPSTVDEDDPQLESNALPVSLPVILRDLTNMRTVLAKTGGELAVSSFVWTVFEGIKFDAVRHRAIFEYLNQSFPFRYRDMERLARFQNRVLRKFAKVNGLPFIRIAEFLPRDPDLFDDAIHANYAGVRVHAWAAAQELAILLQDRIRSGRLPRPAQSTASKHPAFRGPERTVTFHCEGNAAEIVEYGEGLKIPPRH